MGSLRVGSLRSLPSRLVAANVEPRSNRRRSPRVASAAVWAVESLESRVLLAGQVFQVQNNLDLLAGGAVAPNSLRAAIMGANANPGSTITFTTPQAIALQAALPPVTAAGTVFNGLQSPSGHATINGATFNVLDIQAGGVTIEGLSILNAAIAVNLETGSSGALVRDNYLGDVINNTTGNNIALQITNGSSNDTIGGPNAADGNVISGNPGNGVNQHFGILIADPNSQGTGGNFIGNNYIGTDISGQTSVANQVGLELDNVSNNTISNNLISGNTLGINVVNSTNDTFSGNMIGVNSTNNGAIPNATAVELGGSSTGAVGDTLTNNTISNNLSAGVIITGSQNTLTSNTIQNNGGAGILVTPIGERNTFTQNIISGNDATHGQLGIDLGATDMPLTNQPNGGVLPNNANGNQPFPVINSVTPMGLNLVVNLTIAANINTQYRLDLYANTVANASNTGYGQGAQFITSTVVTTDQSATATTSVAIPQAMFNASYITATATNISPYNVNTNADAGSTSEFGQNFAAPGVVKPTITIGSARTTFNGTPQTVTFPVTLSAAVGSPISFAYSFASGTAPPNDFMAQPGIITIAAGATTAQITASVVGDSTMALEEFSVTLSGLSANVAFASGMPTETAQGLIFPTVGSAASQVSLTSSTTQIPKAGTVTLTAVANSLPAGGVLPTGQVLFQVGTTPVGIAVLNASGVATLVTTALPVGTDAVTALYVGNLVQNSGYGQSLSAPINITVSNNNPISTSVSLSLSTASADFGGTVIATIQVTPATMGASPISGFITLTSNGNYVAGPLTLNLNGSGTVIDYLNSLNVGSYNLSASYSGDLLYNSSSTTSSVPVTILSTTASPTTTTLIAASGAINVGSSDTLTVNVSSLSTGGQVPTGPVLFTDNGTALGQALLVNGVATFTPTFSTGGLHTINAAYVGDANFVGSQSASLGINVQSTTGSLPTTVSISSSTSAVAIGGAVQFSAQVTPTDPTGPVPTGTVSFVANGNVIATAVLNGQGIATLTTTALPAGIDTVVADYSGDGTYAPAVSSSINVDVGTNITRSPTSVVLTTSSTTVAPGQSVTLTATATSTAGTPQGIVSFLQGTATIGAATLSNGIATFTTAALSAGVDSFQAVFNGGGLFAPGASNTISVSIGAAPPSANVATISSSALYAVVNQPVTFTVVVTPVNSGQAAPAGVVTFLDAGNAIGTATLDATGTATLTVSSLAVGSHNIIANYSGNGTYAATSSQTLVETVTANPTFNTTLRVSSGEIGPGAAVTLVATVTAINSGAVPTGTVTFLSGSTVIGTAPVLTDGTATYSTSALPQGVNSITAVYSADTGSALRSAPAAVIVTALPPSTATPTLGNVSLPASNVAGQKLHARLPVVIRNTGVTLQGNFTFNVYADANTTFDGFQVLAYSVTRKLNLGQGKTKTINIPVSKLPASLAAGNYYLLVEIVDPNGSTNITATSRTVAVAAPVVTLGLSASIVTPSIVPLAQQGSIQVTVTNTGNIIAREPITLTLGVSSDGVNPVPGQVLTTTTKTLKLAPGRSKTIRVRFSITSAITAGQYYPYVTASIDGATATYVGATKFTAE